MIAAGHRMVADGWALFEEAIEGGGEGDLPQLLCHLRGVKTLTPPPQQSAAPTDVAPTPSLVIKENLGDQPVVVMVGEDDHGPAPNVIPSIMNNRSRKMVATPTYGRSTQEKPLCVPSAVFPNTIWIHCRGMKRNIADCFILILELKIL